MTSADEKPLPVMCTTVEPLGILVVLFTPEETWPLWPDEAAAAGRASSISPGCRVPSLKKLPEKNVAAMMGRQR